MFKKNALFNDLKGKHVFISGGGKGIGYALTAGFLSQQAKVSFGQRSDAKHTVAQLRADYKNEDCYYYQCDVSDFNSLSSAISNAKKTCGMIDILINNAADDQRHSLFDLDWQSFDSNIAVNLKHYYFASQLVAKDMIQHKSGVIVNISSISYMLGLSGYPAYAAANAAITGLTRVLARELGEHKIRVNALAPGWVMTEKQKTKWVTKQRLAKHLEKQCLKQPLEVEDMIYPVLFLSSNVSQAITGQVIAADGGVVGLG